MDEPNEQPTLRRLQRVGGPADAPSRLTEQASGPPDRPDLSFEVVSATGVERAAAPTLTFSVRAGDPSGVEVYMVALSVLLTIEPGKRSYEPETRERLTELFGEPERWAATTGAFRWAQVDVLVPSFTGEAGFEVVVPCTYDHEIAATKYFGGMRDGSIPLHMHFNGTLYYRGADGGLQMMLLPWDLSVRYELPVETWRAMMDNHYPEGTWVRLERATLDRLRRLKTSEGLATYDRAVDRLLDREEPGDA